MFILLTKGGDSGIIIKYSIIGEGRPFLEIFMENPCNHRVFSS